jgi:hypothetical protein
MHSPIPPSEPDGLRCPPGIVRDNRDILGEYALEKSHHIVRHHIDVT